MSRVVLIVPDAKSPEVASKIKHWKIHGEHYAFHGRSGELICGAGNGGAYVHFDGQGANSYVGVPVKWLEKVAA